MKTSDIWVTYVCVESLIKTYLKYCILLILLQHLSEIYYSVIGQMQQEAQTKPI